MWGGEGGGLDPATTLADLLCLDLQIRPCLDLQIRPACCCAAAQSAAHALTTLPRAGHRSTRCSWRAPRPTSTPTAARPSTSSSSRRCGTAASPTCSFATASSARSTCTTHAASRLVPRLADQIRSESTRRSLPMLPHLLLIRARPTPERQALDFHGGLAPIYIEASGLPPIPVALTLHNALYQVVMPPPPLLSHQCFNLSSPLSSLLPPLLSPLSYPLSSLLLHLSYHPSSHLLRSLSLPGLADGDARRPIVGKGRELAAAARRARLHAV